MEGRQGQLQSAAKQGLPKAYKQEEVKEEEAKEEVEEVEVEEDETDRLVKSRSERNNKKRSHALSKEKLIMTRSRPPLIMGPLRVVAAARPLTKGSRKSCENG